MDNTLGALLVVVMALVLWSSSSNTLRFGVSSQAGHPYSLRFTAHHYQAQRMEPQSPLTLPASQTASSTQSPLPSLPLSPAPLSPSPSQQPQTQSSTASGTTTPSPSQSPSQQQKPLHQGAITRCDAILGITQSATESSNTGEFNTLTYTSMDEVECLCDRLERLVDKARDIYGEMYRLPHRFSLETQRRDNFVFCIGLHTSGSIVRLIGKHNSNLNGGRHGAVRGFFQSVVDKLSTRLPKNRAAVFWGTTHDVAHISKTMAQYLRDHSTPVAAWNIMIDQIGVSEMFPDYYFSDSGGYANDRNSRSTRPVAELINKVVWRGVSTGFDDTSVGEHNWAELPRAKLCLKARDYPHMLDAKLSRAVQVDFAATQHFQESGIMGGGLSQDEMQRYRGVVDIDGNGNAWSGAFWKLLSGSVTLKVDFDFTQWYYDRLKPWTHYVPVKGDLSDLRERVEWVVSSEEMDKKQRIATESTNVMLSVTLASSVDEVADRLEKYFFNPKQHPLLTVLP